MAETAFSVSAIIPLYNGARFIEQALDSVFAQELPPIEVIVVDDGSTDDGAAIVRRYAERHPVTLLQKPNGGQSSARNFGIRHSSGSLIALLDQDDLWYPHHLHELVHPFQSETIHTIGWTYSNLDEIGVDGRLRIRAALSLSTAEHPKLDLHRCLGEDMFILPSASVILRSAFDAVGGLDERLSGYEDDDLFLRLFHAGYHNVYIEEPLGQWRVYATSSSFSARMAKSRMIYARKLLDSFPDQPTFSRFYGRDMIAPRFLKQVAEEAREALRRGDLATAEVCLADIEFLERKIAPEPVPYPLREYLLVTAVIILHNGGPTIGESLRSVLRQSRRADEIIVVDDGSTDDGPAIVQQMAREEQIRLITIAPGSRASARNVGVEHAHGDLIAFLDQDDLWYPHHLNVLLGPFIEQRAIELGWTYGDLDEIGQDGLLLTRNHLHRLSARHPKRDLSDCLRNDMAVFPSAALVSRRAYRAVGGYDERLVTYEDDDLFLRLFQAGYDNIHIDHSVCAWRRQRSAASSDWERATSRTAYLRKLSERFPDDPESGRFYVRELIVPRFLKQATEEARQALRRGDLATAEVCLADIEFLERKVAPEPMPYSQREYLLVTAVITLHNGAAMIGEALRSVLRQSRPVDEIIVVDDGSTDDGPAIVQEMARDAQIRLITVAPGNRASARNVGVEHAHGDLIAFLDQDDVWYPNHLDVLLGPFTEQRSTELGWTYGDLDEIGQDGSVLTRNYLHRLPARHPKRDLSDCLRNDMAVFPSAALVSRRAYRAVGGYDERLVTYEDDDLFLRIFQAGYDNAHKDHPVCAWRRQQPATHDDWQPAANRIAYLRKLAERFPDDPASGRFYVRDLIAPRFFRLILSDTRKAFESGTPRQQQEATANLRFVTRSLPARRRFLLEAFLLPALRSPTLARAIMRYRIMIFRVTRWAF